ncbi:MAG: hypothetical protein A3F67_08840 [Verrucomicrobia bacterium RIFCSPHIGHO2_12_FULL_41_10]|nr:MAG: hypothetical protein A3F67_08840 [Verrucomicrobia bacterium RIFCSPHIGHO2_12_FULL_41_10]HLB32914.1 SDR family oxidoreductase [Chthoniobacterales bacterium]
MKNHFKKNGAKLGKLYIIISASSDIGYELTKRLVAQGAKVIGTYRTMNSRLQDLEALGVKLYPWNAKESTGENFYQWLKALNITWNGLIICHGTLQPIGKFKDIEFSEWSQSLAINFTSSLEILHKLLPLRNLAQETSPTVLFFAGGGTNSAPTRYSAYTISKIALIKMCELLQEEIPDTRFTILGPGWVKTKIHQETLQAGMEQAGEAFYKTQEMLSSNDQPWVSMDKVIDCCLWALRSCAVGGRNISVAHDPWESPELEERLKSDSNLFKLRRKQ